MAGAHRSHKVSPENFETPDEHRNTDSHNSMVHLANLAHFTVRSEFVVGQSINFSLIHHVSSRGDLCHNHVPFFSSVVSFRQGPE